MAIIGLLSTALILNFRSSSTGVAARRQAANAVVSDIRRMQSMALAGSNYGGQVICAFGISIVDKFSYRLFARPRPVPPASCSLGTYVPGSADIVIEEKKPINSAMTLEPSFSHILFKPPYGTAYPAGGTLESVDIFLKENPSGLKTTIRVSKSGRIDIDPI